MKKRIKKNLNSARQYCSPEDIVAIKDNANESNVNDAAENFIDEDREKDLLEKSLKKVVKKWSLMCTVQLCMNRNVSNQSVEVFLYPIVKRELGPTCLMDNFRLNVFI